MTALTECGLRDGLLMDYLSRGPDAALVHELSVRERSVLRLVRACGADEAHARHVARLALELFDSSRAAGYHDLGAQERELLDYTALPHDVGTFVSYPDHHVHSAYLIANADLLGFDQREIAIMAATALFHRKATPSGRYHAYAQLGDQDRATVRTLANLLRLAERLDRSHSAVVRHARLEADGRRALALHLVTKGPAELELWGLENRRASMEKAMGRRLSFVVEAAGGQDAERAEAGAVGTGRRPRREGRDRARGGRRRCDGSRSRRYSSPTTCASRRLKPSPRICDPHLGEGVDQAVELGLAGGQVGGHAGRDEHRHGAARVAGRRLPASPGEEVAQDGAGHDGVLQVAEVVLHVLGGADQRLGLGAQDLLEELQRVAHRLAGDAQAVKAQQRRVVAADDVVVGPDRGDAVVDHGRQDEGHAVRPRLAARRSENGRAARSGSSSRPVKASTKRG